VGSSGESECMLACPKLGFPIDARWFCPPLAMTT
jgi:hypothetical protein